MAFTCPSCSAAIPGVTTEEALKQRLADQKAAHTAALDAATSKATAAEAELAAARPLAARAEALERDLAYQRAGIPDAASKAVETLYRGYRAEAGDAAVDRAAWLADATAQGDYAPMVAAVRTAAPPAAATPAATPPAATPPAATPPARSALPPASAGAAPAPGAVVRPKMTATEFQAATARLAADVRAQPTAELRAKARADYDAKRAEMVAQMDAPASPVTT